MERTYRYRMSPLMSLFGMGFFGACLAVFVVLATDNDQGLVLNGIVTLGVQGATWFYLALGAACAVFVGLGLAGLVMPARTLVVGEHEASVPSGFMARNTTRVVFADVVDVSETNVSGTRMFTMHQASGNGVVNNRFLRDRATYEEVKQLLLNQIEAARASR